MAMMDAALLSVSYAEVEEMVGKKLRGAVPLRAVTRRLTRAVVVLVILTNTINVLGPILVGGYAVQLYGNSTIGIMTAVLTFGTIIFSEIIPKALGTHYAPHISRAVAPLFLALIYALFPVVVVLEKFVGFFKMGKRAIGTEEQIRALVRIGGGAGHILQNEGQLIHRVFILNDRRARDLMTSVKDMIAVPSTYTIREALTDVARYEHSHYPVYDGKRSKILGIVLSNELAEAMSKNRDGEPVLGLLRDVPFVASTMRADMLLNLFRRRHVHLVIVRDGDKAIGLVTFEDVLRELVGEIEEEREAGKILT